MIDTIHSPYDRLSASRTQQAFSNALTDVSDTINYFATDNRAPRSMVIGRVLSATAIMYKYRENPKIVALAKDNKAFSAMMRRETTALRQELKAGDPVTVAAIELYRTQYVSAGEREQRDAMLKELTTVEQPTRIVPNNDENHSSKIVQRLQAAMA